MLKNMFRVHGPPSNRIEPQINVLPVQAQGAGLKSIPAQVEPSNLISDKRQA